MKQTTSYISSKEQASHLSITARLLTEQALLRGWEVEYTEAYPDESDSGITRCSKNGNELFFDSDLTALTPIYGFWPSNNKNLTYNLLRKNNIPTPETYIVPKNASDEEISRCLSALIQVVVKPLDTNHGVGITIGADTVEKVRTALELTKQYGKQKFALLQKQVTGEEYRFLVLRNKVIAVACRKPPFVIGDGKKTISELIEKLNFDPRRDNDHKSQLTIIKLSDVVVHNGEDFLKLIPKVNQKVELLKTSNLSRGGFSEDYSVTASNALKKIAIRAAKSCFLGIAGIDIMTTDIRHGDESNSFVIETNIAPGLRMHEFPIIGEPRPVAKLIFKELEKHAHPIARPLIKLGRSEFVDFPNHDILQIPARVDTGAAVSALHASLIKETSSGGLSFISFDKRITTRSFTKRAVQTSTGQVQIRYMVKLPVSVKGRKVIASFTLANRSKQSYPILIGRNIISRKFIVDVRRGKATKLYLNTRRKLDSMVN
jgi:D-alanine-D-alanine ligase-like ATP-grasp enzyme